MYTASAVQCCDIILKCGHGFMNNMLVGKYVYDSSPLTVIPALDELIHTQCAMHNYKRRNHRNVYTEREAIYIV